MAYLQHPAAVRCGAVLLHLRRAALHGRPHKNHTARGEGNRGGKKASSGPNSAEVGRDATRAVPSRPIPGPLRWPPPPSQNPPRFLFPPPHVPFPSRTHLRFPAAADSLALTPIRPPALIPTAETSRPGRPRQRPPLYIPLLPAVLSFLQQRRGSHPQ